jgi:hypothetical protein
VDLAAADAGHQGVPRLLDLKPLLHPIRMIPGHVEGALITQEVRQVQQKHVEGVAFDPFPVVELIPKCRWGGGFLVENGG